MSRLQASMFTDVDAARSGTDLCQQVMRALDKQQCCTLNTSGQVFLINGREKRYLNDTQGSEYPKEWDEQLLVEPENSQRMQMTGLSGRPVDELLWSLAWHDSGGQMLEGCRRNDVVSFSRWPNLTRLPKSADTYRIVALLKARPTSVVLAARLLGISEDNVVQVYCAGQRAGYAHPINRVAAVPEIKPHRHRSLIVRLFQRLQQGS